MFHHNLQLVALSALWGTSFMLTRFAAPILGPNLLAALRMGMAAVALACIMRRLRLRWPIEHWRELGLLALLGVAAPHAMFAWSALYMPAGYSALLYVTSVLFGALASAWMKEESLTGPKLAGCVLGIVGAAFLVQLGPLDPSPRLVMAVSIAIVGAAVSGMSAPMLKRAVTRMDPLAITAGMHLIAFVLLLPGAIVDWPRARFSAGALAAVFVMGTFTSGIAWWLYARIMRHVSPLVALSSTFMITAFGVLWAVLFLGETLDTGIYLGGALLVLSCLLVMGFDPRRWMAAMPARSRDP
ncbi:MAG: DMT family transporter [Rhodoferax sp.]|nr:DMT family transporter [Rhodoferax sp.]MCW5629457.1 DMT family transporter [Rhodoferax sp.]